MSKTSKRFDATLSGQGLLFDNNIAEGALDVDLVLRDSLIRSMSRSNDSRYQIASKISELTRHNFGKDTLDKVVSNDVNYNLQARLLPAFCMVTKSLAPFEALLEPLNCSVVTPEDNALLKLARLTQQRNHLSVEIARLETQLGIKGGK